MGHFLHRLCGLGIWVAVTSCADGPSRGVEDLVGFLRDGRTIRSPISLPVLLIVGGMTACVVVPTPPTHSGNARQNVDASTSTRFHPGKSTREGVILSLGEPDVSTADERKLSYRTEMTKAWLLVGGYASGAAARINKDDYLVFEFDRKGDRLPDPRRILMAQRPKALGNGARHHPPADGSLDSGTRGSAFSPPGRSGAGLGDRCRWFLVFCGREVNRINRNPRLHSASATVK